MVNLILDLDETLIHTIISSHPDPTLEKKASFNFQFSQGGAVYYVFKRPGLNEFLEQVFKSFDKIGIWTAADRQYAKLVIKKILNYDQIMNLDFVFSRDFCESDQIGTAKPLSKIYQNYPTWKPKETIMLDNSSQVMRNNPQNGILAIDFMEPHMKHDIYLYLLTDIFRESLPKTSVYQFVDRVNKVIPYIVGMYQMSDDTDRHKELKETLKLHKMNSTQHTLTQTNTTQNTTQKTNTTQTKPIQIAGKPNGSSQRPVQRSHAQVQAKAQSQAKVQSQAQTQAQIPRKTNSTSQAQVPLKTLDIGMNLQKITRNKPLNILDQTLDAQTLKAIQNPNKRKALLMSHF